MAIKSKGSGLRYRKGVLICSSSTGSTGIYYGSDYQHQQQNTHTTSSSNSATVISNFGGNLSQSVNLNGQPTTRERTPSVSVSHNHIGTNIATGRNKRESSPRPLVIANPQIIKSGSTYPDNSYNLNQENPNQNQNPNPTPNSADNMSSYGGRSRGDDSHLHHNGSSSTTTSRKDGQREFIPSFVLLDECKSNNERKIRDWCRKLQNASSADVEAVANFQDGAGRTPLSYACGSGNVMIIDELSKLRKVNPNLVDNEGMAPLHYASQAGHSEAVDLMLLRWEGSINPNVQTLAGLTPLMKGALQGRTRCCKSLIQGGASVHIRDNSRNLTAIEWARLCGRHITAEVIIRCAIDNYQMNPSEIPVQLPPPTAFNRNRNNNIPMSQSLSEIKRVSSSTEESNLYNMIQNNRTSKGQGSSWLKSKLKKVLGTTTKDDGHVGDKKFGLMSNMSGPTLCASSLLLPSIKPILDQQKSVANGKSLYTNPTKSRSGLENRILIPTVCVTDER